MALVNTTRPITAESCEETILALTRAYPFMRSELLTRSAFGRPVRTLVIGTGPTKVIYSAAHHANEWITALILLKFAEDFATAVERGGEIFGTDARALAQAVTVYMVPMVDPDGVDLVVGALNENSPEFTLAQALSGNYPNIPFPAGWKANLLGVDLNLQYPAGWLQAREIKFSQGFTRPGPRDYVGRAPLDQKESRALYGYTQFIDPALVIALHSQGKEIYWKFKEIEVPGAKELGQRLAEVSGYTLADPAYASSFAGYKDWFIQDFRRPGYTVEVGTGENPLPLEQFPEIYRDNLALLVTATLAAPDFAPEE